MIHSISRVYSHLIQIYNNIVIDNTIKSMSITLWKVAPTLIMSKRNSLISESSPFGLKCGFQSILLQPPKLDCILRNHEVMKTSQILIQATGSDPSEEPGSFPYQIFIQVSKVNT
jgi:hypothetical protein